MNKTKENTGADVKPDNSGHRERLKKRFMLGGGRDFPDYEMLELLLTLSIPRRDVKQIANSCLRSSAVLPVLLMRRSCIV